VSDVPNIPDNAPIFENGIKQDSSGFCMHDSYTVAITKRQVVCNRCKAVLDPFEVVERWARRIAVRDNINEQIRDLRGKLEQLHAEEKRVKARLRGARKKDADAAVEKALAKFAEDRERAVGALRLSVATLEDAMRRVGGVRYRKEGDEWKDGQP